MTTLDALMDRACPEPNTGCRLWEGPVNDAGYGKTKHGGRTVYVHRLAWELHHGRRMARNRLAGHACDTPPCCNPAHVQPVTHRANMAAMRARGRSNRGTRNGQAVLTDADVVALKAGRAAGRTFASLGREFGVTRQQAWRICAGVRWRHLQASSAPQSEVCLGF